MSRPGTPCRVTTNDKQMNAAVLRLRLTPPRMATALLVFEHHARVLLRCADASTGLSSTPHGSLCMAGEPPRCFHGKIQEVGSEPEVSSFVNEAEQAFSREHTHWVARQQYG